MKRIILPSVLLMMGVTEEAMAVCADDPSICYTQVIDLASFLPGKTVCDGSPGNWKGQEWHSGSSGDEKNLIDYKFGRTPPYTTSLGDGSNPYGPSEPVGTWSISGDTVTYGYYKDTNNTGAGTVNYSYKVWQKPDGTYDFCNGGILVTNVTIQSGQGACIGSSTPIACPTTLNVTPSGVAPPGLNRPGVTPPGLNPSGGTPSGITPPGLNPSGGTPQDVTTPQDKFPNPNKFYEPSESPKSSKSPKTSASPLPKVSPSKKIEKGTH